jgi:hypothetical protein
MRQRSEQESGTAGKESGEQTDVCVGAPWRSYRNVGKTVAGSSVLLAFEGFSSDEGSTASASLCACETAVGTAAAKCRPFTRRRDLNRSNE